MWLCCHQTLGGLTCGLSSLYHTHFSQGGNSCYPMAGCAFTPPLPARHRLCVVGTVLPPQHGPFHTGLCTADTLIGMWGDPGFVHLGQVPEQQAAVLGKAKAAPGCACPVKAVCAIPFQKPGDTEAGALSSIKEVIQKY